MQICVCVVVMLASPSGSGHAAGVVMPDFNRDAGWVLSIDVRSERLDHCVVPCP